MTAELQPLPGTAHHNLLLRNLLHAFYWLDDGLQAHMRRHAGFSLPRAQSMMMVCIGDGIDRPSDLARRLRVSKQAVQQGLAELVAKKLVEVKPDPTNGRQKLVTFTKEGRGLRDIARAGLEVMEEELARRIGTQRFEALNDALEIDWGEPPTGNEAIRCD